MSHRSLIALLVIAIALASAVPAAGRTAERGIELAEGSGRATLALRGAVLGVLGQGRLTVIALAGRDRAEIFVEGFAWVRRDGNTMVYGGKGIRFRVFRGSWRIRMVGRGINASAVGRGLVGLAGSGRYALSGGDFVSWPSEYQLIRLG
jgi:hypothetical protein